METVSIGMMRDFAVGIRQALRDNLTLGPAVPLGMWQWTLMDGSTWAAVLHDGDDVTGDNIIGWAGFSQELDLRSVIGVYIAPTYRGRGYATTLVRALLSQLLGRDVLATGEQVYATTSRWPQYEEILDELGLECVEWQ